MTRQSDAIGAALRKQTANAVKALILEIDKLLRTRGSGTPVDTGHARANWVPSVGTAHAMVIAGTGSGAHDAGVSAVLAYKLGDGACWLSNAVPYIASLNDGHSAQAPSGFVEAAIDQALAKVRAKFGDARIVIDTVENYGANIAGNLASAYNPLGGDQ